MTDASQIAAAIDQRVRQLEAQGITGMALANHMLGHMQDLHGIYSSATDLALRDLCDRFPGFERYAGLMEEVSEQNQAMLISGSHPYADLPELPEPLKAGFIHVLRAAAELEREIEMADARQFSHSARLTAIRQRWADNVQQLVSDFRSARLPPRTQALVQQVVMATAERLQKIVHEQL